MKSILLLEPTNLFWEELPSSLAVGSDSKTIEELEKESPLSILSRPLGLLTLHSFITSKNIRSKYLDLFCVLKEKGYTKKKAGLLRSNQLSQVLFDLLKKDISKHDSVGISITYGKNFWTMMALCKLIKHKFPNKKIILGGNHIISLFLNHTLTINYFKENFDFAVIFDGENSLYALLKNNFKNLSKIPNLIFLEGDKLKVNIIKNDIDINKLPLVNCAGNSTTFMYETGRGCSWQKCTFCMYTYKIHNCENFYVYREKSVKKIINDLKLLKNEIKNKQIKFVNHTMSVKQASQLSDAIQKENIKLQWHTFMRFEKHLSFEILKQMKNAGCYELRFGLESADPVLNKKLNKGIDLRDVEKILKDCKTLGIKTVVYGLIGLPQETFLSALRTSLFLFKNRGYITKAWLNYFVLVGYCDYFYNPSKYGIIKIGRKNGQYFFISRKGFFYKTLLIKPFLTLNYYFFNKFTNMELTSFSFCVKKGCKKCLAAKRCPQLPLCYRPLSYKNTIEDCSAIQNEKL